MTEEREVEVVAGTVGGITQRGPDKWQIEVKPDGSQYGKKLWTKSADQVALSSSLIGQHATFECNVSHWTNSEGKPVRSLWVNAVNPGVPPGGSEPVAARSEPQRGNAGATPQRDDPTRDSIEKQVALKAAVEFHNPEQLRDENVSPDDVCVTAARFFAFLQGTAPAVATQEVPQGDGSGGYSDAPAPGDEGIPF